MADQFSTQRQVLPEYERALLIVDFMNPLNFDGVAPGLNDIAILKPRHSAFCGTPLNLLLQQMQVRELIVTGLATDICVQMTAMDAYLRAYPTWVPRDCCAAEDETSHTHALACMQNVLKCRIEAAGDSAPI